MELWTAFLLGLIGSLHCAGMCGPIALAIPFKTSTRFSFVLGRIAYNMGRITTYCLLGILFGAIGKSFAVIGWQRWVSLFVGIAILATMIAGTRVSLTIRAAKPINFLKGLLSRLLKQNSLSATFLMGLLNGFLPCGLVYAACAGAAVTSGFVSGIGYMGAFGAGTLPMMLGVGLFGKKLQFMLRFKLQKSIPITLVLMSLLLILRGLALGIPYLSPDLAHGACCHH